VGMPGVGRAAYRSERPAQLGPRHQVRHGDQPA
jgi:hypothetical protein